MNKVKYLRNECGLSVRELTELINVTSHPLITRIENNKNVGIKNEMLNKLCTFFMVEANYLLGLSNDGILCKNDLGNIVVINEEEYKTLSDKYEIFFNSQTGRVITKNGEQTLSEMRSKDFDKNMLHIMQGISSNGTIKEIIPLLSQLNETQLEIILNTIKVFIGK
jgi:transcriptional regulator with XRE-family HTH domain